MGYSFILATVSGVGVLIMAVSCCIISQNMSHPPVVAQTPGAQPMVVMATTNPPMMYPQAFGQVPGQPPPIYGHYVYTNPPHPGHYAYPVGEEQACHQPVREGMQTTHAQGNEYGIRLFTITRFPHVLQGGMAHLPLIQSYLVTNHQQNEKKNNDTIYIRHCQILPTGCK